MKMPLLKLQGTPREVGRQYGEACREGFRAWSESSGRMVRDERWERDVAALRASISQLYPRFWDELVGVAEGTGLSIEQVVANHRRTLSAAYLAEGCCTNIAFNGPDGPVFGKNLDLSPNPEMQYVIRDVTYENGQGMIHSCVVGEVTSRDTCMNVHGLTLGGSSVGSVFQQSIHNPPIEVALYEMLCTCAEVEEAIRFLQRYPYVGKGYNLVLADAKGAAVVLEAASPLIQVRRRAEGEDAIFCTNTYKLPALLEADLRPPHGKMYSEKRWNYLQRKVWRERVPRTVEQMKALLSAYGPDGGLCRPIDPDDESKTRMSIVTLPAKREFWVADGVPAFYPYERVK